MKLLSNPHVVHRIAADYRFEVPTMVQLASGLGFVAILIGFSLSLRDGLSLLSIAVAITGIILLIPQIVIASIIHKFRDMRYHIRDAIVLGVDWRGDEHVLDVGVGSGLTLFGCARKLTTGRATGIDLYMADSGGGSPEIFWKNAAYEGLAERVELQVADARNMPFETSSFDVIVSTSAFHHMGGSEARQQAAAEIIRVLKPGGRVLVYDLVPVLDELAQAMQRSGFINIRRNGSQSALIRGDKPA